MCINVDLFIVAMNNCEFIANKPTKYVDLYHINPQLFLRHLYEVDITAVDVTDDTDEVL